MAIYIIFGVGSFVSLLVSAGLFFTVMEIQQMGKHPENYRPKAGRAFFSSVVKQEISPSASKP